MDYYNNFWGMNLIWWAIWIFLLFWIFVTPYDIPGHRRRRGTALDILQKRFAAGKISNEEYMEKKQIIVNDLAKLQ